VADTSTGGVNVIGLKEFRAELRKLHPQWPRALATVHKTIADTGARRAQGYAQGMGGIQAKASGAIVGRGDQRYARIGVSGGRGVPFANVAFWGAKRHTGWYAQAQYAASPPQHPPWVGSDWEVGVMGQGPYAINPAIALYMPELLEEYGRMVEELAAAAFPD
jgi:hypothetical protein